MGFWNSLWEGVKEGGKFVVDNAGDIFKAGQKIAEAVKDLIAEEEEVNIIAESDPVLNIFDKYGKATEALQNRAKCERDNIGFKEPVVAMIDPVPMDGKVCGLFRNPVAISQDSAINHIAYQDISKFLTLHGVPARMQVKITKLEDPALIITQALFANAASTETEDIVVSHGFNICTYNNSCTLDVGYAYYPIPLGHTASDTAWHCAIDIAVKRERKDCMIEIKRRAAAISAPMDEAMDPVGADDVKWKLTLNITWADRVAAEAAVTSIPKKAADDGYTLDSNSATGNVQIIKVLAPSGKWPGDVKVDFTRMAREITPIPKGEEAPLVLPQIDVIKPTPVW